MSLLNKLRPLVLAAGLAGLTTGCSEESKASPGILVESGGEGLKITIETDFFDDVEGFTPEALAAYHPRLKVNKHAVKAMLKSGITPLQANSYDSRFNTREITSLHGNHISSELANQYDKRFGDVQIRALHAQNITPEVANAYDLVFNLSDMTLLFDNKLMAEAAHQYVEKGFKEAGQILALHDAHVLPQQTDDYLLLNKNYGTRLDGYDIARLVRNNVPFAEVEKTAREHMVREAMK